MELTPPDDLIPLKPPITAEVACPACGHKQSSQGELLFQGIHVLAVYTCVGCGAPFYRTLPAGHDLLFPASFSRNGTHLQCDPSAHGWLITPLLRSLFKGETMEAPLETTVHDHHADAIILNCLDNRFGHSFAKLWNATILKERYPSHSIIIFIPSALRWLVPDGMSEVWTFNAPLRDMGRHITNLDAAVKQAMVRFQTVRLSPAYTHLAPDKIDLRRMLRTDPFDLAQFAARKPTITFVLREDRFWQSSPIEFFLFKVAVKFNLPKRLFVWRQNYLANKTAGRIRKQLPEASFSAVGIGRHGRLTSCIADHRKDRLTTTDEHLWCQLYAASHVIVGVHGSSMLIPTALGAGFVEILPRYKIRHIGEDISLNYSSRYMLFLGRHVDQYATTRLVSRHVVSMVRYFPYVHKNMVQII